jgi:hypothetical protein
MGLLKAAIFQGASQGLNVLGQGMMRDIAQGQEQSIWEKRQALLAQIQRENAQNIRQDDLDFREQNAQRARAIQAGDIAAQGEAQTAADLARRQNPGMLAADQAKADSDRANKVKDAQAVAEAQKQDTIAKGGDKAYISALRTLAAASQGPDRTDYKGRELENAIKQIAVDNAKRADGLRKEFGTATPERQKQISDELSVLTGKDNDKFMPVPLKDEMGNTTGYKIFDTKRGQWVEPKVPQAQAHAEAKAALASGAPLDAINARLESKGYAPIEAPSKGEKRGAALPKRPAGPTAPAYGTPEYERFVLQQKLGQAGGGTMMQPNRDYSRFKSNGD